MDEKDAHLIAGAAGVACCLGSDFVKVNPPKAIEGTCTSAEALREASQTAGRTKLVCAGGSTVDAKTFLLDDNLVKVDRMTMANSLEARVPLLDHELLERVARIPPAIKSRGLQTKRLLRRAVRNLLPPEIRKGKKKGFTPPLPFWIRNELKGLLLEYFSEGRIRATGFLNEKYCQEVLHEHLRGEKDNNRQIWTIFALLCWLEKYPLQA